MNETEKPVIWLMGPTSSGKTTVGARLVDRLRRMGVLAVHYDGDEVRGFFGPAHGFRPEDRLRVVRTLVHLANKASGAGLMVVVSALTANRDARAWVRAHAANLVLVHLQCPIAVCAERDPKGLYARARKGDIKTLIGFNTPYPAPARPDIVLDTHRQSVEVCVEQLLEAVLPGCAFPSNSSAAAR